tara:strand:+ start:741 stop:941 length:201 start_codon:yes stop_codon:yes gene_type:complete
MNNNAGYAEYHEITQALTTTTDIALDAIKIIRMLGHDELANTLTKRLLIAQKNIYGGNPPIQNGGN